MRLLKALLICVSCLLAVAPASAQFTHIQYGDVTAPLTQVTSYNAGTGAFTGRFTLGPLVNQQTGSLTVSNGGNGIAVVTAGQTGVVLPQPHTPAGGNWSYKSNSVTLSAAGVQGNITLLLPTGVLYRRSQADELFRESEIQIGTAGLDGQLRIKEIALPPDRLYAVQPENEPYWLIPTSTTFSDAAGFVMQGTEFLYIHDDEAQTGAGFRRSNDQWMRVATVQNGAAQITPNGIAFTGTSKGDTLLLSAFPYELGVNLESFTFTVAANRISSGSMNSPGAVFSYRSASCDGGPIETVFVGPATYTLGADGALLGQVNNTDVEEKRFDFDAYKVGPTKANGTIYVPGWRGSLGGLPNPAQYLLAGRQSIANDANSAVLHPEDDYIKGVGSYAGYTLSPSNLLFEDFSVTLACQEAPMVSGASKLYFRAGGASGSLDATPESVSNLAPFNLYGEYATVLTRFNNTFLDSAQAGESAIDGNINLPFPANTSITFKSMELEACGTPGQAKIDHVTNQVMAYWNREFKFASLEFRPYNPPQNASCGTEKRTLWTTSTNRVPELGKSFLVSANFKGNGDIREADIIGEAANTLQEYPFSLRDIYYSKWDGGNQPAGKTVVIGDMKLPFWGATPVVALWEIGNTPQVFDGRPYAATPPQDIDPDRNGFPNGIADVNAYLASAQRRPLVQAKFANLIDLSYRVKYNNIQRRFATESGEETARDLVIIELESRVRGITKDDTDIAFGASYDGIPSINLSSILDDQNNPAVQQLLAPLKQNMDVVNKALNGNFSEFIREKMADATRPAVYQMVDAIKQKGQEFDAVVPQGQLDQIINNQIGFLDAQLKSQLTSQTGPVVGRIDQVLTSLEQIEQKISTLNTEQVRQVLQYLVSLTGGDGSGVDLVMDDVDAARDYIVNNLINTKLRPALQKVRNELTGNGNLLTLKALFNGPEYDAAILAVKTELQKYMDARNEVSAQIRNLDREKVNQAVVNAIYNSGLFQQLTQVIAQVLEPIRQQMQEVIGGVFDAINNGVKQALEEIGSALNSISKQLNDVIGVKAAELKGYAVFGNESMDRLHIDAAFELSSPDAFSFRGSLDMERFKNNTDGVVCGTPAGMESIKTKIATYDIPINFGRGDLRAKEIALYLRLNDKGQGLYLSDVAGKIETTGSLNFEAVKIISPLFRAGVGENETYLAFKGKLQFNKRTVLGGMFLGKTCNGVEILKEIDPEIGDIFTQDEITGIYAFGEGTIPIYDYSCMLRISATVGAGFWYFVEGPSYGGKLTAGVMGEGLCIVGVRGKLVLAGGKEAGTFVFKGSGWLAGGIGACEPETWILLEDVWLDKWCYTCALYADVLYRGEWSVDYGADCE